MAEKFLLTILEIGVACSPIILLLLLISPLLEKRYGSKLRCMAWLALAVRLVIPFNTPWQHAVQINLFSAPETQTAQYGWFLPNPAEIVEHESESENQNTLMEQKANRYSSIRVTPISLAAIIWAAGAVLFLLYHVGAYLYTLYRLRRWSRPIQDEETLCRFAAVKKDLSVRNKIRIYKSSKAASPLLLGFIRPRMILPDKTLTQEQLDFMLRHELWHLKRGDLWYKLLMLIANAIHWFNPLVWLMDRQANLDTEFACDADVLRGAGRSERKTYGYTILTFMEQGWRCKTPLTSRFYGGKTQMKRRFYNITDTSNKKQGTVLFCVIAIIIVLSGCAVYAAGSAEQTTSTETVAPALLNEDMKTPSVIGTIEQPLDTSVSDSGEIAEIFDRIKWSKDSYTGGEMSWPFYGNTRIIQPFGESPQIPNDYHTGLDIAGEYGAAIIAANDGIVKLVSTEWTPGTGYGMYVIIDHGGETSTLYAHCSKILVSDGDSVVKGEKIAEAGATGFAFEPHLHFEVRLAGVSTDPMPYITSAGFVWPTNGGFISLGLNAYPGHTGIDIMGIPEAAPVYAAASGTIVKARDSNVGYGKHIIIDHGNGYQTLYAHNSELYVSVGDVITKGQTIAAVGRSGNTTSRNLHFEIRHDGKIFNPEDFLTAPSESGLK